MILGGLKKLESLWVHAAPQKNFGLEFSELYRQLRGQRCILTIASFCLALRSDQIAVLERSLRVVECGVRIPTTAA
jgi:hypothetical protein